MKPIQEKAFILEGMNRAVQDIHKKQQELDRQVVSISRIFQRVSDLEIKLDGAIKDITHIRRFIEIQFPNYDD